MGALPSIPDPPLWAYGVAIVRAVVVMIRGTEPFSTIEVQDRARVPCDTVQ